MNERQELLLKFAQSVKQILGESLCRLIVYGSYARGDYNEYSDIDIMILTTLSDKEIEKAEDKIFDLAYDMELDYGVHLSPIVQNEAHFRYWLGAYPFYDNVEKEGVTIG
ncbi:MAG: nucleotidyltransferase domain-containing protein [Eubacteriales bacterium]|nr:nucleotidyltransferase domain-containing protein [Eubacteriales bacterium]